MNKKQSEIARVLRGEVSACEAYDQVINKVDELAKIKTLIEIKLDHTDAVNYWKSVVDSKKINQARESGPWGMAVKTFVASSHLLGNNSTFKAMKLGEEHGLRQYKDMLIDQSFSSDVKNKIKHEFIPTQLKHIQSLEKFI